MSKYLYRIMNLPIQRYLKWWLDKMASIEKFIVGFSNENPATLINCLKAPFISFKLGGRTVQDGTPTPENPIPIENVEGTIQIKKCNKNLAVLLPQTNYSWNGLTVNSYDTSSYLFNQTASGNSSLAITNKIYLKAGTYTISQENLIYNNNNNRIVVNNDTTSGTITTTQGLTSASFTLQEDTIINMRMVILEGSVFNNTIVKVQLEKNSTKTDYIPHAEKTYNFPLSEGQVLMQDGTIENKVVNEWGEYVFTGEEIFTKLWDDSAGHIFVSSASLSNCEMHTSSTADIICKSNQYVATHYDGGTGSLWNIRANDQYPYMVAIRDTSGQVCFKNNAISTTTDFKTYLATQYANGTPVKVQYKLATPDETAFTTDQQAVIDEIINDGTYKEVTHIEATASLNPLMEIEYKQKR